MGTQTLNLINQKKISRVLIPKAFNSFSKSLIFVLELFNAIAHKSIEINSRLKILSEKCHVIFADMESDSRISWHTLLRADDENMNEGVRWKRKSQII